MTRLRSVVSGNDRLSRGTVPLYPPVPREYTRLFPETLGCPQAPPRPRFTRSARVRSAVSAGGGPDLSEPRQRRRRRGSRGCGDGVRGIATGRTPLGVTVASTRSASRAEHGDSLCPRPPRLAQLEEPPASGANGPPREGVSSLAQPYRLRGDAAAERPEITLPTPSHQLNGGPSNE